MLSKTFALRALTILALTSTALTPLSSPATTIKPVSKAAPAKTAPAKTGKAPAPAAFTPMMQDPAKPVHFAQDYSDIKPDPAVRFGRLANGMTYAIMKNATPPGTASVRLRIGGGSMMETEEQRGLAHFIEHMAFNGSKNVPEGEMVKILERHGLKFGPDTNAFTSFDQTVYQLDLPTVSSDDLDTALMLMRETAGNLLLTDDAIDRERGVILGEERLRDSPDMHDFKKWSAMTFAGQKYPERLPIGLVDVIKNAKRDRFVDFYNAFYRPELATLVVVGDIDVNAMEARIKAKFSDWKPAGGADIRRTEFGAYKPKGTLGDAYSETGLADSVSMTWAKPKNEAYQTVRKNTDDVIDQVRMTILNDRLERQAKLPDTAFAAAGAGKNDVEHTADVVQLNVTPKPGQDKKALDQAYRTTRQYVEFGADQAELDRTLADMESGFKTALQGEKTRNNRDLADALAGVVESGEVFTSPAQDYAYFESIKPKITLATVNAGLKPLFGGDGPILWHSGENTGDLDKTALAATYSDVQNAKLAKAEAHVNKPWPYTQFGTASAIVKREEIKDLGITELTYANGLKAIIKPTKFKENEIGVTVRFSGGLSSLSPASHPPVFEASAQGVSEGGLGKLTAAEIKDALTGKIVGIDFGVGEDAVTLNGGTRPADFATEMQLLMAFTTDAAYRADAWERLKAFVPNYYTSLSATPSGVFQMNGASVLHSGDPRFGIPPQADFLKVTNDQIKGLIDGEFKTAPVEITIVGDITEAQAEAEINKTFAALNKRDDMAPPADAGAVKFPTDNLNRVFEHHGRADQNLSYVAWPTTDTYANTQQTRGLEMLAEVMSLRLIDVVRENKGLSYSPNAGSRPSATFKGYGYLAVSAEVRPELDQTFYDTLAGIVSDLKAKPIGDDELLRARKPTLDKLDNDLKTNVYWNAVLPGAARDPRRLEMIRTRRAQLEAITPADLQKLANTYLDMSKSVRIQVKPAADAKPAAGPAPAQ
ncbi:MAG TPA: insulinase family protein [Asticcacaulis sp.]|nr:insulinase family protein [Asticcacaulis sp.]